MSLMGAGPAFQDQRVHSMKRMKELALRPDCRNGNALMRMPWPCC